MLEENKKPNRYNLYDYPLIEDSNFHYRGQLPKFNKTTDTFSQLCRFITCELDKLPRSEKYKDLFAITTYTDEKVKVKCMICQEEKSLSFKGELVDQETGLRVIEFKNFWSHAQNFHLSEFTMKDIIKYKSTTKGTVKASKPNSIKNAFQLITKSNDLTGEYSSPQKSNSFTNRAITTDIANLIIFGNFPFALIESLYLREAIRSILTRCQAKITNIKFQSRRTVTRRVKEMVEKSNNEYCDSFLSLVLKEAQFCSPFFPVTNDSSTSVASVHYSVLVGSKICTTSDGSSWTLKEYYLNCSATSALSLKAVDNYTQMKSVLKKLVVDKKIHNENENFELTKYLSAGL